MELDYGSSVSRFSKTCSREKGCWGNDDRALFRCSSLNWDDTEEVEIHVARTVHNREIGIVSCTCRAREQAGGAKLCGRVREQYLTLLDSIIGSNP